MMMIIIMMIIIIIIMFSVPAGNRKPNLAACSLITALTELYRQQTK